MPAIAPLHSADAADIAAQDATKQQYDATVLVTSGKRYALGVVALATDDGDDIRFSVDTGGGFTVIQTRMINVDNLANVASDYFEDGVIWEATATGSVTIRVAVVTGTATIEGVIIREPDSASGVVEDQGSATHCSPLATIYDSERYQIHCEMYTGNLHLSKDGVAQGKVIDAPTADYNERYHNGGCVVTLSTGILVCQVGHNESQIRMKYLPGGVLASASAERTIGGGSSSFTYIQAVALADDTVVMVVRGTDSGGQIAAAWILTNATDLVANTPTAVEDVLFDDQAYPRSIAVQDDGAGNEVVCVLFAGTAGVGQWRRAWGVLYAHEIGSVGEWYNLNGIDATVQNARGTNASPRFNSTMSGAMTSAGGIRVLGDPLTGQRYMLETALWEVTQFAEEGVQNAKAAVMFAFVDSRAADAQTYGLSAIRFGIQFEGNERKISPQDFQEPQRWLEDPNGLRQSASLRWLDDDPTTDEAILIITDRATRLVSSNNYGEQTSLYYDWGGQTIKRFRIADPLTAPVFTLNETYTAQGDETSAFISDVAGEPNVFIYQSGDNELHPTHRQTQHVVIDDGGGANTEEVELIVEEDWPKKKPFDVSNANIDADLPYFPLAVHFEDDTDVGAAALSDGSDIRFTKPDGTLLNFKKRSFSITDGAATGSFILMTDLSASAPTGHVMWYGNSEAEDGEAAAHKIYDSAHLIVCSLDQDPSGSAPQITDETWHGHHGTVEGTMASGQSVAGALDNALDLQNSTDDVISFGELNSNNDRLMGSHAMTIEILANLNAGALAKDMAMVTRGAITASTGGHPFTAWRDDAGIGGNNLYSFLVRNAANNATLRTEMADGSANASGVWDGVGWTYRANQVSGVQGYKNGVASGSAGDTSGYNWLLTNFTPDLRIGRDGTNTARLWDGLADELRISLTDRAPAWLKFGYHNIAAADNELSFGAEQGGGGETAVPVIYRNLQMQGIL